MVFLESAYFFPAVLLINDLSSGKKILIPIRVEKNGKYVQGGVQKNCYMGEGTNLT